MPWSLQTVGSTIFYIPGGSNLPLAGTGNIGTNSNGTIIMVGRGTKSIAVYNITGGTWSIPSTLFSTTGRSVAVGNSKYVAVGEGTNTFAITNNGTTWGTIASPPFSTAGYDIVYAGSTWVAVGTGTNSVAYFDNQTSTWVSVSNGITSGYGLFYDATVPRIWATGLGTYNIAYASAANSTWTGVAITGMTQVNAVGSGGGTGKMITVGYGNSLSIGAYSTNYTASPPTFTNLDISFGNLKTTGGQGIAYGNGTWVWGGSGNAGGNSLASSTDGGITWTGRGYQSSYASRVIYANNIFVVFALVANGVATSGNGILWTNKTHVNLPQSSRSGCYDSATNTWYVTGGPTTSVISKSTDNFTSASVVAVTTTPGFNGYVSQVRGIDVSGNTIIATGLFTAPSNYGPRIVRSVDSGSSWSQISGRNMNYGNEVKYNKGVWLCGGNNVSGDTILFKSIDDGYSWSTVLANTTASMISVNGIYSDGTRWYISGAGAAGYQFAYSKDNNPLSISDFSFVSNITMGGGDIAVSPASQLYVAGGIGTNNLQTSSNGTSWTSVTSPFSVAVNDVKNNGTTWVAVGEGGNTIATSSNGSSWTGQGTATFSIRGNKVRWNSTQNKWYAVGEGGNTLVASTDGTGTSWTSINTTGYVDISGMGLAFN